MRKAILAAALVALLAPASAEAFQTCTHVGTTMTATFGTDTSGRIFRSGTAIHVDTGSLVGQCGTATINNTDDIVVNGDADGESFTIDLSNGPYAPGMTAETASSEIEFDVNLQGGFLPSLNDRDLFVDGSPGADTVTVGAPATAFGSPTLVNLNADETSGVDADVVFDQDVAFAVRGLGGADTLNAGGGQGIAGEALFGDIFGGSGADDITVGHNVHTWPGEGNDTITTIQDNFGIVRYDLAGTPDPVELTLLNGTGGAPGGGTAPTKDGFGTTDTYFGAIGEIWGTNNALPDKLNGGPNRDRFLGQAGPDIINGGAENDTIFGGNGADVVHGDGADDDLQGDGDDDEVYGDAGNDAVDGRLGDDDEFGGEGDDLLRESGGSGVSAVSANPNGADDLNGGPGTDTVQYGVPSSFATARTAAVSVDLDGAAGDDGATGEGDTVHTDVENVTGGNGNDTLVGDGGPNVLRGLQGGDTLRGGGGGDTLEGFGATGASAAAIEAAIEDGADDLDGQDGGDTINANDGDDTITARDGAADTLNCGAGNDTGAGDRVDTINSDCEGIALPVEMPPDPPVTPPAEPPVVSPPVVPPVVVPPPVVTPQPPPRIAEILSLPSSRRCASRRKFTVRVRREIRGTVRRVTIFLNGRRVKTVTGARIGLPIDLRGLPKGRIRVRLRVELTDGRVATDTRTYRTCATKKRRGQFG